MIPTKTDLAQIRMNTLIEHLPGRIRSDVLSGPDVVTAVGGVHRPVKLSSDTVISREELFHTLRDLFDGKVRDHLTGLKGDRIEAEVSSEPDGVGAITVGRTQWRFAHADLLARNSEPRVAAFEQVAAAYTLTVAEEEAWRARIRSAPLDDDSFSALMAAIEATPETFVRKLNEILDNGESRLGISYRTKSRTGIG
jgi:hypothetical protein